MNKWSWNPKKRGFKTIRVSRRTKLELDQAIEELEKRGFRCVERLEGRHSAIMQVRN
ncbi:hypothetical protein [Ureibacillus terrenus]|uniref:hypothetical protein n=1 Tax=Ureibacillus terrenus TaxID=118246 RepID=UPI0015EF9D20|nr:hypothetical protein [Ureibacillus terrenus]